MIEIILIAISLVQKTWLFIQHSQFTVIIVFEDSSFIYLFGNAYKLLDFILLTEKYVYYCNI